jgi:hydrogenase maturation protease
MDLGSQISESEHDLAAKTASTLLLGLGNELLTDDAVGLRIAAAARAKLANYKHVHVAESSEMGLALLDHMVGFKRVVVVDAVQTGGAAPGFLHEGVGKELNLLPLVSPHFLGLGETLALGRELGLKVPEQVRIFAVEVEDPFTIGTGMTQGVEAALPEIVERIVAAITTWR